MPDTSGRRPVWVYEYIAECRCPVTVQLASGGTFTLGAAGEEDR